jgi:ribosomal protein S18 acetylase RimI-like enzyme
MGEMIIRTAALEDSETISKHDKHIPIGIIKGKIARNEVFVVYDAQAFAGWLRYSLFWDSTPFMNMLYLLPDYRGRGIGRQLVQYWEGQMKEQGYEKVLTSTQQNEYAQHFYVALGYKPIGGFSMAGDLYEIIFEKAL